MLWLIMMTAEAAAAHAFDQVQHLRSLRHPERRRGLVEDDQLRVEEERSRYGNRLALAARQEAIGSRTLGMRAESSFRSVQARISIVTSSRP